ncbi:MAG: hypothetical protein E7393_05625 [Ruminococcaceae bacterium]|nr:hypothetical protein [Oscillospiraceae bacterium]
MKMRRLIALLMGVIMLTACLSGCGGTKEVVTELPWAINEMDVDVIDDLPDWTGEQLELSVWHAYASNHPSAGKTMKNDVFHSEVARVSGITLDKKNSFDNGGDGSADARVAQMVATKAYPHIGVGVPTTVIEDLAGGDKLWALDEYIPKYMPNYWSIVNKNDEIRALWEHDRAEDGKTYNLTTIGNIAYKYIDPEFYEYRKNLLGEVTESRQYIYVRDDILKTIHPEAYSLNELQDIYVKNGSFTEEELTDFTIKSIDEFKQLLVDIKGLNLKENGRTIWPTYTANGGDNWSVLYSMMVLLGTPYNGANSYFIYLDREDGKLKNTWKEDWYKEYVKFWAELPREGLAPEEALIDNNAAFEQKVNNGEYAVLYGTLPPTQEALKAAGKDCGYRKVFLDITPDDTRFTHFGTKALTAEQPTCFFKDKITTEAQLEQVLRLIDFCYSDAGMKFAMWGPQKAGLYTETEDGLRYTDPALEKAIISDGDTEVLFDYGFSTYPVIQHLTGIQNLNGIKFAAINKYAANLEYAKGEQERAPEGYTKRFNYGFIAEIPDAPTVRLPWHIFSLAGYSETCKTLWSGRSALETEIKRVLATKTDEEFEKAYQNVIDLEESMGYTDEAFEEINQIFVEMNGQETIDALCEWEFDQ